MSGPGNPVPNHIVEKVNASWETLFEGLQDLAEWLEKEGHGQNLKLRPCDDVPLFRRSKKV